MIQITKFALPGAGVSRTRRLSVRARLLLFATITIVAMAGAVGALALPGSRAEIALADGPNAVAQPPALAAAAGGAARRPNIVFVLTDDLSMDLLRYMPGVQALEARGMTFSNYFVSDSLCCPSRASIFTGDYPHDTGVYTNAGHNGGIGAFFAHGDESHTFNLSLWRAGYSTAMMGKYLNGYLMGPTRSPLPASYVPSGWSRWDVAGWGYPEFDYPLNENGTVVHFGHTAHDYLTDVLARRGVAFIDNAAQMGRPFFLELATFTPHDPYVPAPRDRHDFPGLVAPRPPSFDTMPTDPPTWLAGHPPLSAAQVARIDEVFRLRAQDVQSVDDLLTSVQQALVRNGLLGDTYVVFSSDNGLHTGEYRLMPGKLTAFDTDIHVPLVIAGPGIAPGSSTDAMTENVDLAETFAAMGGATLHGDGHSLLPLLDGLTPTDWRDAVLIEHRGPAVLKSDPDRQNRDSGNPPSYEAMRTPNFLFVEYANGEKEFYDLKNDPFELHNVAASLSPTELATLHAELARLETCHGARACWSAGHVAANP